MKQKFTYLLSLMLMCIFGVSNAMAEDVVVYSMSAPTAPTDALDPSTGSDLTATFVGGTGYVFHAHASKTGQMVTAYTVGSESFNAVNLGGSGGSYFKADLSSALEVGDLISIYRTPTKLSDGTFYMSNSTSKGSLKVTGTYTVKSGDAYVGKKVLYFFKDTKDSDGESGEVGSGATKIAALVITRTPAAVAPSITAQPQNVTVTLGGKATLALTATGGETYQWYKATSATSKEGATAVSGATAATYQYSPAALGTEYFYCKVTNGVGSVESNIATVTIEEYKPITTARAWRFDEGDTKWMTGLKASTDLWEVDSKNSNRVKSKIDYNNEELRDNSGVLAGISGVYFTGSAGNILAGYKSGDTNERCVQITGNNVKVTIPRCNVKDRIYVRFGASGTTSTATITSSSTNPSSISKKGSDRTNAETVVVTEAGDVELTLNTSVRLYEIKVTPYFAVTDFELSAEEVSVEEFDNVTVSGTNFAPANYTDGTLNWTSSDENVATVKDGVITGVKEGKAIITATSVDGPSKTVEVTVTPCAPKNASIEMTSNSGVAIPKVESGKTFKLTAKAQGYGLTYQWAVKTSEKGSYSNISGATSQTYEETAGEFGTKWYKVTITNAQGTTTAETEEKKPVTIVAPLEAFAITEEDAETGETTTINYQAIDADEPQVKVVSQATKAGEETNVVLPEAVEYNGVTYAVTTIGEEAYVNDNTVVSFTAPETLVEISARAFMSCVNLSEVTLNNGLKVIGDAAFSGCNALTEFSIPASVEYVGFKAFTDCKSLTDIYYDGTKAEWDALPYTGLAGIAKSVTIHFNDGETEGGKGNIVGISNANADEAQKDGKFVENGQIVIYKNGKKYNAAGAEIK